MRTKLSKNHLILLTGLVGLAITFIVIYLLAKPSPSVAAYCKTYREQEAKITANSSAKILADSYGKLEQVAPNDIKDDTKTLHQIYQKIDADPSQKFTASLSGLGAEANVESWVKKNCKQ